ncbi:MAG: hypothetical protein IPN64_11535 [Propionivibrio sp.]|uniref:hypothetical protein n=1 Tax=Propionivibrio sp. TaxID=2212460 RepID=UPI0026004E71|nr:hypothetical protein [Propionivibrio sp.]MBK8894647.1 hypothetical protein [Propionivibrio sp.]
MSQQINLYDARLRPRHELAVARNLGIGAMALLLLMTLLSFWVSVDAARKTEAAAQTQKLLTDEQERLTALTKTVSERRVSPALSAELDNVKAMLASRNEIMTFLDSGRLGNTSGFSTVMTGFARLSQNDIWLTGFQVTVGGEEIEIRGRLLDSSKLPAYVQRLSSEPVFKGRRFAALEMKGIDPDEEKTDRPALLNAVDKPRDAGPQSAVAKLPRFVEFVLRSENVGGMDGDVREGARR